jgi:hypothetical protein
MADTLIRRAARALDPGRPTWLLQSLCRSPRQTVRSWSTHHRRPPIAVLEIVREALKGRQALLVGLIAELDDHIAQRKREPILRRGFHEVRPRDGAGSPPRDARNRLGRPSSARITGARHVVTEI